MSIYNYRAATVQELNTFEYRTVNGRHYTMTKLASGIPHFYLLMVGTYRERVMEHSSRKVVGKKLIAQLRFAFGE